MAKEPPKCLDCGQPMIMIGRHYEVPNDLVFYQCPECKEVKIQREPSRVA